MATTNSTTSNRNRAGAKMQKYVTEAAPFLTPKCQFGAIVFEDGSMSELKVGHFTADQAEEIASRLVVLASKIRNTARRCA